MKPLLAIVLHFLLLFTANAADFAQIEHYNIEYQYQVNPNSNITILLEAGARGGLEDFEPIFEPLTKLASVIRYARVGNGHSTQIKQHFTSLDYGEQLSQFLDAINIKQPVFIIAHSYGGNVARDFSAHFPQKVSALLLLDPSSEHDVDILRDIDLKRANKEIAQVKLDDMKQGMSNNYLDFWSKRPLPDHPQIGDIPLTVIASVKHYNNPPNLFFTDLARKKWGEMWQAWAQKFPQGHAVLTKKSGHFVQFDEPELVITQAKLILEKLAK